MTIIVDGNEYQLVSESAQNGDLRLRQDGKVYKFDRASLELTGRMFRTVDSLELET